jgi:hypothetical protein
VRDAATLAREAAHAARLAERERIARAIEAEADRRGAPLRDEFAGLSGRDIDAIHWARWALLDAAGIARNPPEEPSP